MRRIFIIPVLFSIVAVTLRADFSYQQSSKITGGAMAGMMKVAGAFSKQAREPMQATISVKGDRLSMMGANRNSIIDLTAETMTEVDLEKKTYAVITFAEFSRAMQKLSEKMGEKSDSSVEFKAEVKQTGAARTIDGFEAKQAILTLQVEGQDKKSGDKGAMNIVTEMWLAPNVPGYEEVKSFYTRMAQKLAWAPGMGNMGAALSRQGGMMKGMSELYKESAKLDGVPMLQVVRMGGAMEGAGSADAQQAPPPSSKLGGLASGIGGFGGFGRKKKEPAPETSQAPAPSSGVLMELTTEMTGFSSGPVDQAKVTVPAGFKQVDHEMQKALK